MLRRWDRTPLSRQRRRMPETVHGVIFANELLDALPTHVVVMTDTGCVKCSSISRFRLGSGSPSSSDSTHRQRRVCRIPRARRCGDAVGWRAEVNLGAED
jgi:SAM-dependent MidA family methyltransferase